MTKRLLRSCSTRERAASQLPASTIRGDMPGGPPWPKEPVPPADGF